MTEPLTMKAISCVRFLLLLNSLIASCLAGKVTVVHRSTRCQTLLDGWYADGCSSRFYVCTSGNAVIFDCPPMLYFDSETKTCNYMYEVPACRRTAESNPWKPPVKFTCSVKGDGFYALGLCSQEYVICKNVSASVSKCKESTFFNPSTKLCSHIFLIPSCSPLPLSADRFESIKQHGSVCGKNSNNVIALVCSQKYYVCANGDTISMNCPSGTVYNKETSRCDYRAQVPSCKGSRGLEPESHAPIIDSDVFNEPSATEERAADRGVMIAKEVAVSKAPVAVSDPSTAKETVVAKGIKFDKALDTMENSVAPVAVVLPDETTVSSIIDMQSSTERPATTIVQISAVVGTASVVPQIDLSPVAITETTEVTTNIPPPSLNTREPGFCTEKDDGNYAIARCNENYISCVNHISHIRQCPAGLVYDGLTCDYKHHIAFCNVSMAVPVVAPEPTQTTVVPVTTTVTVADQPICLPGSRYAEGPCSINYIECENGVLAQKQCATGKIFDRDTKLCVTRSESCGINALDNSIFDPVPRSCEPGEILQRGQCLNTYFECLRTGRFALFACSANLMFDPLLKQCRPQALIVDCTEGVEPFLDIGLEDLTKGVEVTTILPIPNPLIVSNEQIYDGFQVPLMNRNAHAANNVYPTTYNIYPDPINQALPPVVGESPSYNKGDEWKSHGNLRRAKREVNDNYEYAVREDRAGKVEFCAALPNGKYGLSGCRADYFVCIGIETQYMRCLHGLVYNAAERRCTYPGEAPACGGSLNNTFASKNITKIALIKVLAEKAQAVGNSPSEVLEFECTVDGVFDLGCSRNYLVCERGNLHVMQCPDNFFYNGKSNMCVQKCWSEEVAEASIKGDVWNCTELRDGYYGKPCSSVFATCRDGTAIKSYCGEGLQFDLLVSRCVPKRLCGKMSTVVEAAVIRQKVKAGDCKDLPDGYPVRMLECENEYFECQKGELITSHCPPTKVFSMFTKSCIEPSECRKSKIPKHSGAFCVARTDGLYRDSEDCSRIIQCQEGESMERRPCPEGLVFNEASAVCDYAVKYPECSDNSALLKASDIGGICKDRKHGDFVTAAGCSKKYYRCIWSSPVEMSCPDDTVFNPVWGVCDHEINVSECNSQESS